MGIKKTLKHVGADVLDVYAEAKDLTERVSMLHKRVNTVVDAVTTLERQLRPPTLADAIAKAAQQINVIGRGIGYGPRATPDEPLTVYQMLKALYDRMGESHTPSQSIFGTVTDIQESLAKLLNRQHQDIQTSSRTLARIETKLGQQNDLEGLIKELKATLPEVTSVANNVAKMRANAEKPMLELTRSVNGIHIRLAELRSELHGLMDDERAERQRLGTTLYQHLEPPAGANVVTDASPEAEDTVKTLEAQLDEVSTRLMARSTLERVRTIDTRIKHMATDLEKLIDRELIPASMSVAESILDNLTALRSDQREDRIAILAGIQDLKDQLRHKATANGVEAVLEKLDALELEVKSQRGALNTIEVASRTRLNALSDRLDRLVIELTTKRGAVE